MFFKIQNEQFEILRSLSCSKKALRIKTLLLFWPRDGRRSRVIVEPGPSLHPPLPCFAGANERRDPRPRKTTHRDEEHFNSDTSCTSRNIGCERTFASERSGHTYNYRPLQSPFPPPRNLPGPVTIHTHTKICADPFRGEKTDRLRPTVPPRCGEPMLQEEKRAPLQPAHPAPPPRTCTPPINGIDDTPLGCV